MAAKSSSRSRARRAAKPDVDELDDLEHDLEDDEELDAPAAPRRGQRRTVLGALQQLPNFLRLLYGLMTDGRVSAMNKALVAGAIAYIIMPIDFLPDFVPFLGEIDDLFLLILALKRLINEAGRTVLLDHWAGPAEELADLRLEQVLAAAAFFLPRRLRRRLRTIGRL